VVLSWQSGQAVKLTVYNTNGSVFDTRSTTQAPTGSINYDTSPLYFGEDEAGDNWKGTIDEVRIYNRALTVSEIQTDMVTPVGSSPPPDTTPPTTPSNLTATVVNSNQINLNWTASADNVGVTGYRVERCGGIGCTAFTQIATPTGTTYSDIGLTASTTYNYRVRASDAAGNLSGYSETTTVTTQAGDTIPPTTPSNLTATAVSSSQVNLSWTAATDNVGVAGYQVERCSGTGCSTFTQLATPTGTVYSDTGLTASTVYSYRVRAADGAGNLSGYSNTVTATTQAAVDNTPPSQPTNLTATSVSSSQINLSWTASTDNVGVTSYQIERCQGAGCTTFTQIATQSGTTYSDMSLAASSVYNYRVRATDAAGNLSTYSAIANATTAAGTPTGGTIAAYAFSEGSGSVTADSSGNGNSGTLNGATWTTQGKSGNALSFNGTTSRLTIANSASLQAPTTALTISAWVWPNGTSQTWSSVIQKINASNYLSYGFGQNAGNVRRLSGYLQVNGVVYSTPMTTALGNQTWYYVVLSWQSGQAVKLTVYNADGSVFDARSTSQTPAGSISYDASLLYIGEDEAADHWSGTIDEVRIYNRVLSQVEIQADMVTPVGGAPGDTTPPTAPDNLSATALSSSQINLSWTAATDNVGVAGYQVERCVGTGCTNFTQVGTSTGPSYSDTGLTASTSYSYRVRAYDANLNMGPYTNVASAATLAPDTASPTSPSNLTATATSVSQISLSWTASTDNIGVTGYRVERCAGTGCTNFTQVGTSTGPSYSDTGLTASTSYSYRVRATDAASNLSGYSNTASATTLAATPDQVGQWGNILTWPIVAVHAALLPTGKVLAWDYDSAGQGVQIWNPATNTFTAVPYNPDNLFCAGLAALRDGRILVAGGHVANYVGITGATLFNPTTQTWSATTQMAFPRWYPTVTTLPDGRALVTSGAMECHNCNANTPEVYDPTTGSWTPLTNATLALSMYPHIFVLPDGRVLVTGSYESYQEPEIARVLDLNTQTWTTIDPVPVNGGSAAMYLPGKIITSGLGTEGGADVTSTPSTATTYVLDMTQPAPAWRQTAPMAFPRDFHNLTLLPDGTVLVTGGGRTTGATDPATAVFEAELWSPVTEAWTTLSSMQVPRRYHSTALLLPDGRVLVAGGGRNAGVGAPNNSNDHFNAEIFSPPYLFKGTRPSITSVPATLQYGGNFSVMTPDASRIATVSLVRLGAVTHAFNMNQRFLKLTFQQVSGGLTVQAPASANLAPPGYYMLFLVDGSGVPSVAAIVQFP
jgi:fibronectin type 3 domain-containing protein